MDQTEIDYYAALIRAQLPHREGTMPELSGAALDQAREIINGHPCAMSPGVYLSLCAAIAAALAEAERRGAEWMRDRCEQAAIEAEGGICGPATAAISALPLDPPKKAAAQGDTLRVVSQGSGCTLTLTTLIHYAIRPFFALCGANVEKPRTTLRENVTCPECLAKMAAADAP